MNATQSAIAIHQKKATMKRPSRPRARSARASSVGSGGAAVGALGASVRIRAPNDGSMQILASDARWGKNPTTAATHQPRQLWLFTRLSCRRLPSFSSALSPHQRHVTCVAVISLWNVNRPTCLTRANVPSTIAVPLRHGASPKENTRMACLPSLRSRV